MPDSRRRARARTERDPVMVERIITEQLLAYESDALPYPVHQYLDVPKLLGRMIDGWWTYLTERDGNRGPNGLRGWCDRQLSQITSNIRSEVYPC